MSTVYYQGTHTAITIGPTGHQHKKAEKADKNEPFAIDCAECEPYLVREGWVYNKKLVPLTQEQLDEQEDVEREGNLAVKQVAEAMAETAAAVLAGQKVGSRKAARSATADEE